MTYLPSTIASGTTSLLTPRENTPTTDHAVLTLSCPQRSGIVHSVSKFLFERGFDIVEHQQFDDPAGQRLYLRTAFVQREQAESVDDLVRDFAQVANEFSMDFNFHDGTKPKVLVMVSKMGHCLNDLIFRWTTGTLAAELVAVVSNHETLRPMAEAAGLTFIHIPVTAETKPEAEARLLETINDFDADLVVLARYMQIFSPELSAQLAGRAINIHHSFLPGFKGARPYHQAHKRGVKQIGATAHYITDDLDEGPIIEQEVIRVDHRLSPQELATVGRDNEALALSKAVRLHVENRVMVDGLRTITFT
ncbi:formyltetrahydrofolate deformylase [Paeniglutamicibacter gangotriensis]|uniref:Formyltetrahydrofolate deformylase n=1 Tax=Paeniglutamicibacter gangotriensis TaxID=254787 RepID=A0A5B0E794_9MICC|nr:formyltetrahydrofolate deformylase [Paeniglutamicibacter gangotriensis]KAA0973239.1 formyltetrahydrofolate deformylase [Paeniglutamicibacter gangotriensis]